MSGHAMRGPMPADLRVTLPAPRSALAEDGIVVDLARATSTSERDFLSTSGFDAPEERLNSEQVAHYDFDRPAVC